MKLHNKFEVFSGEIAVSSENRVTNIGRFLAENLCYAAYILLEGIDGKIVKKTEKISLTASGDIISATYKIELTENEYEGFVINRIGFSPYEDGHETANVAEFDGVCKKLGEALVVMGTLYLDLKLEGARLVGADNPFVPFFLGGSTLPQADYFIVPFDGEIYPSPPPSAQKMVLEKGDSGFRLSTSKFTVGSNGAYIYMNQTPVFHLPLLVKKLSQVVNYSPTPKGTVRAGSKYAEFLGIYVDYKSTNDGYFISEILDMEDLQRTTIMLDKKGYFLTEPSGKYFAAVCESSVTVFESETLRAVRIVKNHLAKILSAGAVVSPENRRIMLLSSGAVAFFGDTLVIEQLDSVKKEYAASTSGQAAIVDTQNGYYICLERAGYIFRYKILGGVLSVLGIQKYNGDLCIFRNGGAIVIISGKEVEVSNLGGRDKAAEAVLAGFAQQHSAPYIGLEGVVKAKDNFLCHIYFGSVFEGAEECKLMSGGVFDEVSGGVRICVNNSSGQKEIGVLEGEFLGVEIAGKRLVAKNADGELVTSRLSIGDFFYHNPELMTKPVMFLYNDYITATTANELNVELEYCKDVI